MRLTLILIVLCTCLMLSRGRVLFFGVTHSGKTSLINAACNLHLPVAKAGQIESTTKEITDYPCLGNIVVDTVGIFDYHFADRFDVKQVLSMILHNAAKEGLSGIAWVWSSRQTVGNNELESIFDTLRAILPDIIPMVIVENQFKDSATGVPQYLSSKYQLPLMQVNPENVKVLQEWLQKTKENYRIVLPEDYEDLLVKHDLSALREKLLEKSLLSCDTVRKQLDVISNKLQGISQPKEECNCNQDCRRSRRYCCDRILGICVSRCTENWIDESCQRSVIVCYETCKKAHGQVVAEVRQLMDSLNNEFSRLTTDNAELLKTCDQFKLSTQKQKHDGPNQKL